MTCAALVAMLVLWAFDPLTAQDAPTPTAPALTEVQTLRLQNYALQAQTIQTQMALLQAAMREVEQGRESLIQGIEKEHPGWLLSRQTLKWEKAPTPAPVKK